MTQQEHESYNLYILPHSIVIHMGEDMGRGEDKIWVGPRNPSDL